MKSEPHHTTVLVPASFRRVPWEPRETGTMVEDALYHLQAQTYSTWAAREAWEKLVNPGPLRLECTFLGRKWLFPWKAQLPRVCMRSMEKVISTDYDSECLSTGLSYWLQRKLNLSTFKLTFENTRPLLPLSCGSYTTPGCGKSLVGE